MTIYYEHVEEIQEDGHPVVVITIRMECGHIWRYSQWGYTIADLMTERDGQVPDMIAYVEKKIADHVCHECRLLAGLTLAELLELTGPIPSRFESPQSWKSEALPNWTSYAHASLNANRASTVFERVTTVTTANGSVVTWGDDPWHPIMGAHLPDGRKYWRLRHDASDKFYPTR